MLSSRERFEKAAKRGIPDRVPVVYYGLGAAHTVLDSLGLTWKDIFWDAEGIAKAMLRGREMFGSDNVCSFLWTVCGVDAFGLEVVISERGEPYVDCSKPLLTREEDLDDLEKPNPRKDGSMPSRIKAAEILSREVGSQAAVLGGFGGLSYWAEYLRGPKNVMVDVVRNRDFQRRYMEFVTECAVAFCKAQVEAGCRWIISAEDWFAENVLGPDLGWEVNGVYAKKLADAVHEAGAGYILHCCGNAEISLERMAEVGADVLSLGKTDLGVAKEKVGRRVALMGNIKEETLLYGSPGEVEDQCKEAIRKGGAGGAYLLSSSYIIPYRTPAVNVKKMVESAEKYGRYK
jgi:uroporphyrinogen decarboxylase